LRERANVFSWEFFGRAHRARATARCPARCSRSAAPPRWIGWPLSVVKLSKKEGKIRIIERMIGLVLMTSLRFQSPSSSLCEVCETGKISKKTEKIDDFSETSSSTNSKIWYELAQGPLDQSWSKTSEHV
jgi:hypothetical protein